MVEDKVIRLSAMCGRQRRKVCKRGEHGIQAEEVTFFMDPSMVGVHALG